MKFRTEIRVDKDTSLVKPQTKILTLGSCFSDEIGTRLAQDGFDCMVNPTGALFNAASVCQFLDWVISGKEFDPSLILHRQDDENFYSWMHHSKISAPTPEELLEKINASAQAIRECLQGEDVLLCLTFGSSVAYNHKEHGIVANCHKQPMWQFSMEELSVEAISQGLMRTLKSIPSKVKILITVSPIRHEYGYGLHHNTLSKARLQLAIDQVISSISQDQNCPVGETCEKGVTADKKDGVTNDRIDGVTNKRKVIYFPAYEALIDDLRDYRFYGDDLVHPAPLAVDYIYELFKEAYMDAKTKKFASDFNSYSKMTLHRPSNPQAHKRALEIARDKLLSKYPFLRERI